MTKNMFLAGSNQWCITGKGRAQAAPYRGQVWPRNLWSLQRSSLVTFQFYLIYTCYSFDAVVCSTNMLLFKSCRWVCFRVISSNLRFVIINQSFSFLFLSSFFKWFSDTQQKESLDGIQDEVRLVCMYYLAFCLVDVTCNYLSFLNNF